MATRSTLTATTTVAVLLTTACGSSPDTDGTGTDDRYPLTVSNCGTEVEMPREPERVVLLTGTDVSFLGELDLLDRVVGKAGAFIPEYHGDEVNAAVAQIPDLASTLDETATLQISNEVIIDAEPDLVIDAVQTARVDDLGQLGIPVLNDEAMCPGGLDDPGFDEVYRQLETFGTVFGVQDAAASAVERLRTRVAQARSAVPDGAARTAAALYPVVGGSPRAYGNRSMAGTLLEEAGFVNVYDDLDERRAEISIEDLIDRDPDVLVLLHVEGTPDQVEDALTTLPGAQRLSAVRNDELLTMLFNFAEPPTPLAVQGLEKIIERFGADR